MVLIVLTEVALTHRRDQSGTTTIMKQLQERIVLIDALRGYALMGLFLVHMVEYYELFWYAPVDNAVNTWVFRFFGGKAYAMFAMLFGVSFYIILKRNADRGTDFRWRFVWRLTLLFAMGYVHGLLYTGDVLQVLAVSGLTLVCLWTVNNTIVLCISAVLLLQAPAYAFVAWLGYSGIDYAQPFYVVFQKAVYEYYAHGSFAQVIAANAVDGTLGKWCFMLESGRFSTMMGLGLLGFWLARINFFTDTARHGKKYWPLLITTVLLATGLSFGEHAFKQIPHPDNADDVWNDIFGIYVDTLLMFATVLILVLLYRLRLFKRILAWFAGAGRMTLSFYVVQSVVMVPFFYHFGFNAWRWIGQGESLLFGITLWMLQLLLAQWWLRRYHYGPLEWCWRAATYGTTDVPFKKSL